MQINDSAATRPQQQYTTGEQQFDSQSQTTSPTSSPPSSQLTAEDVLVKGLTTNILIAFSLMSNNRSNNLNEGGKNRSYLVQS